jgi:hypothetical protein
MKILRLRNGFGEMLAGSVVVCQGGKADRLIPDIGKQEICGGVVERDPRVEILQAAEGAALRMTGAYLRNGRRAVFARTSIASFGGARFGKRLLQKHKAGGKVAHTEIESI